MAGAAYTRQARELELPELLTLADIVREATEHPGFKFVASEIEMHRAKLTERLVHASTKPEAVDYLRGQIEALGAITEAAEAIQRLAEERERAALQESHV